MLAFSWSILMSLNVLFSNLWGILLHEWRGVDRRTAAVLVTGSADPDLFDRISATGKIEKTMKLIDNESLDRQIG